MPEPRPTPDAAGPAEAPTVERPEEAPAVERPEEATTAKAAMPQVNGWRRLGAALSAPRRTQFLVGIVVCIVALALVWQIRSRGNDEMYRTARRADLVQLVDGLSEETRRLESELGELEQTKWELESGHDARQVAREQTQHRLDALSVLAGTAPATGPGIRITISDPDQKLSASVLLDVLGEMRDAGAEVMEFNDTVRVTASTWVGGTPGALVVDGTTLPEVIVLEVIGDPQSLEAAARFRGGVVSEVTGPKVGGQIEIVQVGELDIRSVVTPKENVHARPDR